MSGRVDVMSDKGPTNSDDVGIACDTLVVISAIVEMTRSGAAELVSLKSPGTSVGCGKTYEVVSATAIDPTELIRSSKAELW